MSNILYNWSFIDKKERGSLWYTIMISIVVWLVIWAFITWQYWLSFVVLIVVWLMFFLENNSDDEVFIELSELWLKVWESFYDFWLLESYTFMYTWESAVLVRFNLNRKWIRNIDLKVNNEIVLELKSILPNYVQENPKEELGFVEKMIDILKL